MADYELQASDNATMIAAFKTIPDFWRPDDPNIAGDQSGVITGGVLSDGTVYALNYYGQKFAPTGATQNDPFGNPQPVMAPVPGVFAILRWNGATSDMPPFPNSVTVGPIPADSPYVFA